MANQPTFSPETFNTIKKHIKAIRTALLTTQTPDGTLRTRPMATHQLDPDGTMWFFTREDSAKVDHIRHNAAISLGFADPQAQVTVSTVGEAQIVKDQDKVDALWDESLRDWFPEGKDDPNIILLRITTLDGECWD